MGAKQGAYAFWLKVEALLTLEGRSVPAGSSPGQPQLILQADERTWAFSFQQHPGSQHVLASLHWKYICFAGQLTAHLLQA